MKVKKFFRASRGRMATTHAAFASGCTTQKMLPTGLREGAARHSYPFLTWKKPFIPSKDSTTAMSLQKRHLWQSMEDFQESLHRCNGRDRDWQHSIWTVSDKVLSYHLLLCSSLRWTRCSKRCVLMEQVFQLRAFTLALQLMLMTSDHNISHWESSCLPD